MRESDFIDTILSVSMTTREEAAAMLDRPVQEAGYDSLDFELLRTALEKRLGKPISDSLWQEASTMRHLMERI